MHLVILGERLCDEALRPGESPGEYCIRGSAGQDAGILGCAMSHARRWRATPLEGQRDEARWYMCIEIMGGGTTRMAQQG